MSRKVILKHAETATVKLPGPGLHTEDVMRNLAWLNIAILYLIVTSAALAHSSDVQPVEYASAKTSENVRPEVQNENFVPLLAPPVKAKPVVAESSYLFHGRILAGTVYQRVDVTGQKLLSSRLDLNASIDRINAGPWSFVMDGNVTERQGDMLTTAPDYRHAQPHFYQFRFNRKFEGGGFFQMGRFMPFELTGIGFLDGMQVKTGVSEHVSVGFAGGARPNKLDLAFSNKEWAGSAYATLEGGERRQLYYTGTMGVMQTTFEGKADEKAILWDQQADLSPKLNLFTSAQVDYIDSVNSANPGVHLIRLDVYANSPLTSFLSFRGGTNHYERPDTMAEHFYSGSDTYTFSDTGYWRYFGGASQYLPGNFQLDEDVSVLKTYSNSETFYRGKLSHRGLPDNPQAVMSVAGFNVNHFEGKGVGGSFDILYPTLGAKVLWEGQASFRYSSLDGRNKLFAWSDASLGIQWWMTKNWKSDFRYERIFIDNADSTVLGLTIGYYW